MDNLKKFWDDFKEGCRKQKLEIFLMVIFSIAAIGFGVDEYRQEWIAASGTAVETESETETDQTEEPWTEEETEISEEELEELKREDRRRLAMLGDGFVIPMAMPDGYVREDFDGTDSKDEEIVWHTLEDTRKLYGYSLLIPGGEKKEFAEDHLKDVLRAKVASYDGEWSVYVKNLSTGEELIINDRAMKSASVMKLFIMGTVYRAFESGDLDRTEEIMSLMNDMITYSDNTDSNRLLYYLGDSSYTRGIAKVNDFIRECGFSDMTVEYNGFEDPATNSGTGNYNQISAKDCGRLLEMIYHRELVNRQVSNEIEQMMLNQDTRYKIPAGLPEGVLCGNKSGEMDTTENDAAIIYGDRCDYILVVLSSGWGSKDEAISEIRSISEQVYEYLG